MVLKWWRGDPSGVASPVTMTTPEAQLSAIAASPADPAIGAFFDLDGTLVSGFTATVHAGHRIRQRQANVGEVLGVLEASLRYRLGRMEFEPLVVRAAGYLRGEALADLDDLGEYLFRRHIETRVFATMREVVAAHQDRGHTVAMSSSALTIHAEPVARYLGIDHVICNHFAVDAAGTLTGDIVRPIVWGAGKAAAARRFSAGAGVALDRSYFYADGDEDAAAMSVVGCPRPVNPRAGMAAAAAAHGWPVMCLTSGRRRRPVRRLRLLARHVRRDGTAKTTA
jgi:HAD superfamily hydrolase (TIGR01490 family)